MTALLSGLSKSSSRMDPVDQANLHLAPHQAKYAQPMACTASTVLHAGRSESALAVYAGARRQDGLKLKLQQRKNGILQPVQEVVVFPVLTGVHGDAPAIKKMNKSKQWVLSLCCFYCLLNGSRIRSTVRMLGYNEPATYGEHSQLASRKSTSQGHAVLHCVSCTWQKGVLGERNLLISKRGFANARQSGIHGMT